jgi:hypothetical protein
MEAMKKASWLLAIRVLNFEEHTEKQLSHMPEERTPTQS